MRRTIVTLDTKDGKYIPVFVVMEELYPDMQDYNDSSLHKRPNSYAEGKDNLSLSIEDFSKDNPFEFNGSCGSLEIIGEYAVGPGPDVPGYADQLQGDDRRVLKLRPGITGPATLKYRLEDEMISEYVAKKQAEGDERPMQEIAVEYNDTIIYPDKVRLNLYYLDHYSFIKDFQMILCTVMGKKMEYAGEVI